MNETPNKETVMTDTIKILGTNSDYDTCNRCGKTNLKKVVWVEINEGAPEPIGCECAARLMRRSSGKVWSLAQEQDATRAKEEKDRVHQVGDNRSVIDWYVSKVSSSGVAKVLCRANGSKRDVERWAEEKFQVSTLAGLHVDAPVAMNYAKIEW